MFIPSTANSKLIIVLYVDDGLVAANKPEDLSIFISELKAEFKLTSKRAHYFLGLEIERKDGCIKIRPEAYSKRSLERFNMSNCKSVTTPMSKDSETIE